MAPIENDESCVWTSYSPAYARRKAAAGELRLSAIDSARSARVAGALLGEADLDSSIATLRGLPSIQLDRSCAAVGIAR